MTTTTPRLSRISTGKVLGGVCLGLADYFKADITLIRVLFVLGLFIPHFPVGLMYFILWIVLPKAETSETLNYANDLTNQNPIDTAMKKRNNNFLGGILLIVAGFIFLFDEYNLFDWLRFDRLWPIFMIIPGLYLIFKDKIHLDDHTKSDE